MSVAFLILALWETDLRGASTLQMDILFERDWIEGWSMQVGS